MFTQSEYVAIQFNKDARDSAFQEAEKLRKLQQAGLLRPSRLSQAARHSAGLLGRLMVAVGQRLEKVEASAQVTSPSLGCD